MSTRVYSPRGYHMASRNIIKDNAIDAPQWEIIILIITYSVGKNTSEMFPIRYGLKQGDALSPLLFNCALEYAIKRVRVNQDGLKLNVHGVKCNKTVIFLVSAVITNLKSHNLN